ncbi:hypothetical protein FA13DRAFT_664805 [Coprinellus micaceus]|uniref:Uncharacterized protein n=1 Tax=Coprinellus micaceus TaxID=71717 RepID=A0A4Y7T4S8_COPMI|nr:hypothetical protein FA13DRAFT_664805 [Coprinellus micaceus]
MYGKTSQVAGATRADVSSTSNRNPGLRNSQVWPSVNLCCRLGDVHSERLPHLTNGLGAPLNLLPQIHHQLTISCPAFDQMTHEARTRLIESRNWNTLWPQFLQEGPRVGFLGLALCLCRFKAVTSFLHVSLLTFEASSMCFPPTSISSTGHPSLPERTSRGSSRENWPSKLDFSTVERPREF